MSIDLAKALLAQADKAASAEKTRLLSEVKKIVDEMVNVSSPYQDEAIALRRKPREAPTVRRPVSRMPGIAATSPQGQTVGRRR